MTRQLQRRQVLAVPMRNPSTARATPPTARDALSDGIKPAAGRRLDLESVGETLVVGELFGVRCNVDRQSVFHVVHLLLFENTAEQPGSQ